MAPSPSVARGAEARSPISSALSRVMPVLGRAWPALLGLALGAAFFAEVLTGGRVYYPGDLARGYLPMRAALMRALQEGRMPWWVPEVGAGYPLLAEGEVGALYPLNWLTALLFSPAAGLTVSLVWHYCIAATGMYAFLRESRRSRGAAVLGASVYALGGFYVAHLSHYSVVTTAAWIPWLLFLTRRLLRSPERAGRLRAGLGLAAVTALQFLAGHAQISLLGLLFVGAYAFALALPLRRVGAIRLGAWAAALVGGALVASPQLLASAELSLLSQRAGGLEGTYFTSYSFHPLLAVTFLSPYALGNPYPQGSVEVMGYVGLLPLALAGVAVWRGLRQRQGREWLFYAVAAAAGLALALGRWNPLYGLLERVPVLNLFRVPARYLLWSSISLSALAAMGLDGLLADAGRTKGRFGTLLGGAVGVGAVLVALAPLLMSDVDALVAAWRWLPALLLALAVGVIGLAARSATAPSRRAWAVALALLVTGADLYAYGAVLDGTFSATAERAWVEEEPGVLAVLSDEDAAGPFRTLTKEEILPALSVQREALYPNMALTHGVSSANVYMPLVPAAYQAYLDGLDASRLNRLGVRYYLIPQLLPVDEASELYDVQNPYAALPVNRWVDVPAGRVAGLEVESFLSHAVDLPDGTLVAEILLRDASGRDHALPLRAGLETAEWAYARSDVSKVIQHARPRLASEWPARSGFPPEDHPGYTYLARYTVEGAPEVTAFQIRLHQPEAYVRVERVRLLDETGRPRLLSHLLGLGDHTIAYRSEDVLVYRNLDAWPRAYALPAGRARLADGALALDDDLTAADLLPVEILAYEDTEVRLRASLPGPGYVVLADQHYPGWSATVNGEPAQVLEADGIYRALYLAAGEHTVRFVYRPLSLSAR